mgnify:CR=1 FL=1
MAGTSTACPLCGSVIYPHVCFQPKPDHPTKGSE